MRNHVTACLPVTVNESVMVVCVLDASGWTVNASVIDQMMLINSSRQVANTDVGVWKLPHKSRRTPLVVVQYNALNEAWWLRGLGEAAWCLHLCENFVHGGIR
jgi:hypothetical protein